LNRTGGYGFGRHVLGTAALAFGIITLFWHDFDAWQHIQTLSSAPGGEFLVRVISVLEIIGGLCVQWERTELAGAALLGVIYLFFALLCVPSIIARPLSYGGGFGTFFEEFSLVCGAWIVYWTAATASPWRARALHLGRYAFALCLVSFTLEQVFYLEATAEFVPKWLPPSQIFWAIATTVAFALAAIALFTGFMAPLASKLTTAMIVGFGLLIWVPMTFFDPHMHLNWAGIAQNFAICGAAWIIADLLEQQRDVDPPIGSRVRIAIRKGSTY
jgi:uncharacterized membrane protein YphA (DoxX/SURF4 family)